MRAAWTWPIDADAMGTSLNQSNASCGGAPSSAVTTSATSSYAIGGASAWSVSSDAGLASGGGIDVSSEGQELADLHGHALHLAHEVGHLLGGADDPVEVAAAPEGEGGAAGCQRRLEGADDAVGGEPAAHPVAAAMWGRSTPLDAGAGAAMWAGSAPTPSSAPLRFA